MDDHWVLGVVFHYSDYRISNFEFFRNFRIFANHGRNSDQRELKFCMDDPKVLGKIMHYSDNQTSNLNFSEFFEFLQITAAIVIAGDRNFAWMTQRSWVSSCTIRNLKFELQIFPYFSIFFKYQLQQ